VLVNLRSKSPKRSSRKSWIIWLANDNTTNTLQSFRQYLDQHKLVLVCSARSGSTKTMGTTNLLIQAAKQAVPSSSSRSRANSQPETPGSTTPFSSFLASSNVGSGRFTPPKSYSPVRIGRQNSYSESPTRTLSQSLAFTSLNGSNENNNSGYEDTVDLIKSEHLVAARSSVNSKEILEYIENEIEKDCEKLKMFLGAAQVCSKIHYQVKK
jgi:aspartate kinase